jgi:hypothetical protein
MTVIAMQIAPRRKYDRQAQTREADPAYLSFIRQQPCTVKGCKSRFQEAAHTGDRALGRKASDRRAIPLCPYHHRTGPKSFHTLGRRAFEAFHSLDIEALIKELNDWYEMETKSA